MARGLNKAQEGAQANFEEIISRQKQADLSAPGKLGLFCEPKTQEECKNPIPTPTRHTP